MPTARVIKQSGYTTMSNYHLHKDRSLSLKAKGLLSVMLSLPDETWHFSVRGLASLCGDQTASVKSGLEELERRGYLHRERARRSNGQLGEMIYYIYELPRELMEAKTDSESCHRADEAKPAKAGSGSTASDENAEKEEGTDSKNVEIASFQPGVDFPTQVFPTLDNRTLATNIKLKGLNNNINNILTDRDGIEGRNARAREPGHDTLVDKSNGREIKTEHEEMAKDCNEPGREEIKDLVKELTGQAYQNPIPATPEEVRRMYKDTGRNDASSRYFVSLVCCGLEDLICAASREDGIQIGPEWISDKRLLQLFEGVQSKLRGWETLVYLAANRLISAFNSKKGAVQSPRRYARAVILDVMKADEARWEAELALVERPWLKEKTPFKA